MLRPLAWFSAIKVDRIYKEQAEAIKQVSEEELRYFLYLSKKFRYRSFYICEADIIYPHRHRDIAPLFESFRNVNPIFIDFFNSRPPDYFHDHRWPIEFSHLANRWSKEQVDRFRNFFIRHAERDNKKWRDRFEAKIDSARPRAAERYMKCIFQLDKARNQCNSPQSVPAVISGQMPPSAQLFAGFESKIAKRKRASYLAYISGEDLKEVGKRIGKEFNDGSPLCGKTVSRDAEDYAKENGLPFEKRPKGRGRTRPKNP